MAYVDEVLDDNPVAYYRLTDFTDETANNFDLTQAGSAVPAAADSLLVNDPGTGKARTFVDNNTNGYTHAADPLLKLTAGWSIEIWFKAASSSIGAEMRIVQKNQDYRLVISATGKARITFYTQDGFFEVVGATTLVEGTIYHIVATRSGGVGKVYLNGVEDGSDTVPGLTTGFADQPLHLGAHIDNSAGINGTIDELAIYQTALSAARVEAHYDAGMAEPGGESTDDLFVRVGGAWVPTDKVTRVSGAWF
jgi:hypothetical protein